MILLTDVNACDVPQLRVVPLYYYDQCPQNDLGKSTACSLCYTLQYFGTKSCFDLLVLQPKYNCHTNYKNLTVPP